MTVNFSGKALKQLSKLDSSIQKRIIDFLTEISQLRDPRSRGKLLVGNLRGIWRYRVGDYRILCQIKDKELCIFVVEIGHRREVYEK
ncbi:type II toxin-antitoxin system RelE/ParE family toxin [uncultured Treponema sp.]|uniref:type II toxin-antitoxin system RelE family toxin n=1 Tax=uncultured Treponema sp. TaxID=162155 RepID=UPI0026254727|nr:type II toxin-antitoxin system RelE/ParE family toxin [uncultured Treponema sp.]